MCSERRSDHHGGQEAGSLALSCCPATSWRVGQGGKPRDHTDFVHFISKLGIILIRVVLPSGLFGGANVCHMACVDRSLSSSYGNKIINVSIYQNNKASFIRLGCSAHSKVPVLFPGFLPFISCWMDEMGEELLLYENLRYLGHWPYIVFFFF